MAVFLTASMIFPRNLTAQRGTLVGYRLGQTWSDIGRAVPCSTDSLPDAWKVKVTDCWPRGNAVRLTFVRDTLHLISYVPQDTVPDDTLAAEDLWNRRWKAWTIARYGEPDSVTTSGTHLRQITAFWRKTSTSVQLEIISAPGGHASFVHLELCEEGLGLTCESSWFGLQLHAQ